MIRLSRCSNRLTSLSCLAFCNEQRVRWNCRLNALTRPPFQNLPKLLGREATAMLFCPLSTPIQPVASTASGTSIDTEMSAYQIPKLNKQKKKKPKKTTPTKNKTKTTKSETK